MSGRDRKVKQVMTLSCRLSRTNHHPDGEAAPCSQIQLHHEVDVDKNTEQRQPGEQRDLEKAEKRRY